MVHGSKGGREFEANTGAEIKGWLGMLGYKHAGPLDLGRGDFNRRSQRKQRWTFEKGSGAVALARQPYQGETNRQTVRSPDNIGRNEVSNRKVNRKEVEGKRKVRQRFGSAGGWGGRELVLGPTGKSAIL